MRCEKWNLRRKYAFGSWEKGGAKRLEQTAWRQATQLLTVHTILLK
jgi:hypothetical protein